MAAMSGPGSRKRNPKSNIRTRSPRANQPGSPTGRRAAGSDPKNIILFSDGTGNSSGKLFKTNVWRMYEAADLGPSAPGKRDQIAYYDNGVGTSGFKPLAMLGGILGVGLKRNVLEIYRYACRNYRPAPGQQPGQETTDEGDIIYGFGFSRGAFTMRMLIALIADQGIVRYVSELDLKRKSAAAYRRFRVGRPRYALSPFRALGWGGRLVGDGWRWLRGLPTYDPGLNFRPVIRFVGVWDTVAAYGGPIAELTRAIDNWIYRLSMPDHELNDRVQTARHALSLDDERDSFQPLLWDEVHEQEVIEKRKKNPGKWPSWLNENRLEQVWFCGMHADVGGGYPDESLSYVSLLWMVEEAEKAGMRTLETITERYRALANSFGPMHNSRSGLAAYYRYQPRNISAWLHPVQPTTLSLRDPAVRTKAGPKGLLTDVKIHESVIARIASGTDRYAPFALPAEFTIHPPGQHSENQPQADSEGTKDSPVNPRVPLVDPQVRKGLADKGRTLAIRAAMEVVWDRVWIRRLTYFLTLIATLALVSVPLWIGQVPDPPILSDGRTWVGSIIGLLRLLIPEFLGPWVRVYEHNAFYFLVLGIGIVALMAASSRIELSLRDRARRIWHSALASEGPSKILDGAPAKRSVLERMRTSRPYQRGLQITKWHVLPNIFGPLILALVAWFVFGIYTQMRLPGLERGDALCPLHVGSPEVQVISRDFQTRSTCNPMRGTVRRGVQYDVSFYVVDDWYDGEYVTDPAGLSTGALRRGVGYLGVPLKRVMNARYLQPVFEIRPTDSGKSLLRNVFLYPLDVRREGATVTLYRGQFTAPRTGELYLFANDAVLPFTGSWVGNRNVRYFYEHAGGATPNTGNRGTACVLIARSDVSGDILVKANSPICLRAAEQAREFEAVKKQSTGRRPFLTP